MIYVLGGGANLNFKVVGGTTQPASPSENMIWVNTDTAISEWVFAAEQPASPKEGMVWFQTGTSASAAFNALKKNSIMVCPISAKQYIDGAWVIKDAVIYQGGTWVNWWNGQLYSAGNEYESVTGGWAGQLNAAEVQVYADHLYVLSNNSYGRAGTNKKINVTDFETLTVECQMPQTYSGVTIGLISVYDTLSSAAAYIVPSTARERKSVDISSLSGEYYVYIGSESGFACSIYDVKLSRE